MVRDGEIVRADRGHYGLTGCEQMSGRDRKRKKDSETKAFGNEKSENGNLSDLSGGRSPGKAIGMTTASLPAFRAPRPAHLARARRWA